MKEEEEILEGLAALKRVVTMFHYSMLLSRSMGHPPATPYCHSSEVMTSPDSRLMRAMQNQAAPRVIGFPPNCAGWSRISSAYGLAQVTDAGCQSRVSPSSAFLVWAKRSVDVNLTRLAWLAYFLGSWLTHRSVLELLSQKRMLWMP